MQTMPSRNDIHETWMYIQTGVDRIMTDPWESKDMREYVMLYTAVHNSCGSQGRSPGVTLSNRYGAHSRGKELYERLTNYLRMHLEEVQKKVDECSNESLLNFYNSEWSRYSTAAKHISHLFRYLNRHFVTRQKDEGKKNVYQIYTLHLVMWKEQVFLSSHKRVMDALLRLVERQRNGETVQESLIKGAVDSFVSLDIDDKDLKETSTYDVYKQYFHVPFLAATRKYYEEESIKCLADNSIVEYARRVELCLGEETERAMLYLREETLAPLLRTCEEILIVQHSRELHSAVRAVHDGGRQEDLDRIRRLLARLPDAPKPRLIPVASYLRTVT